MRVQFGIGEYQHRSRGIGYQRSVNCYLEQQPSGTKNPIALLGVYGIDDFSIPGSGPLRGGVVVKGVVYAVSGQELYSIAENGDAILLGGIPNSGRVDMAGDFNNVMVVTNREGYVWDGLTVSKITDVDFPGADWVQYLDTYFVIGINGQVYISGSLAPKDWNALDFATAEASADNIVGGLVDKHELFLGGTDSFEVWYNDANADFPLQRTNSGTSEIGLLARDSLVKYDNRLFFVATDFTVRYMDGYTPLIISKPDIAQRIEDLTAAQQADIYGLSWTESGHLMYAITSDAWTLVYDTLTQEWHSRQSEDLDNWRVLFVLNAYGKMLAGDRNSNKLGAFSGNKFDEWGAALTMICMAQVRHFENLRIIASRLELVFDAGVGTSGQGANPVVGLRQSFDGGRNWGAQRFRPMGATGEYNKRAVWLRLGQARQRLLEFQIADPVRRSLLYAVLDEEGGSA